MTISPYGEECLAALQWGIPTPVWWTYPRTARAEMVATIKIKQNIEQYYASEDT